MVESPCRMNRRAAEPPDIRCDYPAVSGQRRNLRCPHGVVERKRVKHQNRGSASGIEIMQFHNRTSVVSVPSVLCADIVANLIDRKTVIVHVTRVQRDVLAHRSGNAVLVGEAEQIAAGAGALHTSAITRNLVEDFRNIARRLIRVTGSAGEQIGGECRYSGRRLACRNINHRCLRWGKPIPRNPAEDRKSDDQKPGVTRLLLGSPFFLLRQEISVKAR